MVSVAVPVGVALLLGLWPVSWALWPDEIFTANMVARDAAGIIAATAGDRHPPLYYLLTRWLSPADPSDAWLRMPSALAIAGMVAMLSAGAGVLPGARTGAWLLALSPVAIMFGHNARMYALSGLEGALLLVGGAMVAAGRRLGAALLLVGASMALYTHYATAGVVAAGMLAALLAASGHDERETWILRGLTVGAGALTLLLFAPWGLGPFRDQLAAESEVVPRTWTVLLYLFGSPDFHYRPYSWIFLGLSLIGLLMLGRGRPALIGVWAAMALVFPYVVSQTVPAWSPRNFFGFLPLIAVGAGAAIEAGAARLTARRRAWVGPTVAVWLMAVPAVELLQSPASPQDLWARSSKIEAEILDSLIPADAQIRAWPAYLLGNWARYAPALSARKTGEVWTLRTGGKPGGCGFGNSFRGRLEVPEARCDAVKAALLERARTSDYPPLLTEAASLSLEAGDLDAALRWATAAVEGNPRQWNAWDILEKLAVRAGDLPLARAHVDAALEVAQATSRDPATLARRWRAVARVQKLQGEPTEAAMAAATCTAERSPPWWCGTRWQWLTSAVPAQSDEDTPTRIVQAGPTELPVTWRFEPDPLPDWPVVKDAVVEAGVLRLAPGGRACTTLFVPGQRPLRISATGEKPPGGGIAAIEVIPTGADLVSQPAVRVITVKDEGPFTAEGAWTANPEFPWARLCFRAIGKSRLDVREARVE